MSLPHEYRDAFDQTKVPACRSCGVPDYDLIIPGTPIGQPRQRHAVRTISGRAMAVNYTPSKHPVNDYKATIRLAAAQVSLIESACWMSIVAVFPRPSAKVWKTKLMPSVPHTAKPDWDNIGKAVSDALNGIAYRDDSLLSRVVVEKRIAAGGEQPHTKITIGLI